VDVDKITDYDVLEPFAAVLDIQHSHQISTPARTDESTAHPWMCGAFDTCTTGPTPGGQGSTNGAYVELRGFEPKTVTVLSCEFARESGQKSSFHPA
jgi:hypothetical protein